MKEIIFNRKAYKTYEDFYLDLYNKLNGKELHDFDGLNNPLGCNADIMYEFLQYCSEDNIKYIFVNFDKEKIALPKNFSDYKFNIIFRVFEDFVKEYPNNALEFKMEE